MIFKQLSLIRNTLAIWMLSISIWITPVYAAKYKLSVTPRFSSQEILTRLGPLAQFVGEKLRSPVEIILTSDFDSYEERLKAGEFDIAFSNPIHYSKASATNEIIAMEEKDGGAHIRGIVIARADSNIKSVKDLIGKPISIVSWTSTGGFLSQKVFLEEQGINSKTQLKIQEAHDNKQENVILSVYHGDVAAGFINEDALHIVDRYVPPNQIKVVAQTTWLPGWALSVKRTLPAMVKSKIRQAVLGLSANDVVLEAIKLQSFIAATDTDYDVVRKALEIKDIQPVITETKPTAAPQCPPSLASASPSSATTTKDSTSQPTVNTGILPATIIPIPVPMKTEVQPPTVENSAVNSTSSNTPPPKPATKKSRKRRKK